MIDLSGIGAASSSQSQSAATAAKPVDVPQMRSSQVDNKPVEIPAVEKSEVSPKAEERRFARVQEAAKQVASDFYPIGDTRFTIFKDGSGQYITRFTNLKDGSVSYYPEPNLLAAAGKVPASVYSAKA